MNQIKQVEGFTTIGSLMDGCLRRIRQVKINKEKLEKSIQESIESVRQTGGAERFTIYEEGNLQVQILVTDFKEEYADMAEGIAE